MFKLSLVEKDSPPPTFFLIYTLLTCIVYLYYYTACSWVLISLASLTLLILHKCPVLLAQKLNVINCQLKPNVVFLGWLA